MDPPCVNLIDMLAWLSQTTGLINAQTIFNWLEGTLPTQDYLVQTATDSSYPGQCLNPTGYNHGIGLQKTWEALSNGNFNATGWFNYMVNINKIDPYSLMNSLNNWPGITAGTGAPVLWHCSIIWKIQIHYNKELVLFSGFTILELME